MGQPGQGARYGVEQGTDGSWLVVDYGPHGGKRVAIGRRHTELTARREAETLSQLENLTSQQPPLNEKLQRLLARTQDTIDTAHNFNYLLPPHQP